MMFVYLLFVCKTASLMPTIYNLTTPLAEDGVPHVDEVKRDVLVEGVEENVGDARVVPSSVYEQ